MPRSIAFSLFIFLLSYSLNLFEAQSQLNYFPYFDTPLVSDKLVPSPWIGGINGAQYCQMDLDQDGQLDLVVFDKSTEIKHCFIQEQGNYVYASQYNNIFPDGIYNFMQLKDINNDGLADLLTSGNLGMTAYLNRSNGNAFQWEKVSPFLTYTSLSGNEVNLQLGFNDYPFFFDIDDDGDLDVFSFQVSGIESTIVFYRNLSIENTGQAGIQPLMEENKKWGDLIECTCSEFAFGSDNCIAGKGLAENAQHAGGKSVFIADFENDKVLDLITSHQECSNVFSFSGASASQQPNYTNFTTNFPNAVNPAAFDFYPLTMGLTDDAGQLQQLIISSNLSAQLGIPGDYKASNWLYQINKDGSKALLTKAFLQEDMLDLGIQSAPAFWDFDQDGDQDMFVAFTHTTASKEVFSAIHQYENVGDASSPAFELINEDFLNFRNSGLSNLLIQFIDMDQDGSLDLAFQATEAGENKLFVRFQSTAMQFSAPQPANGVFIGFGYSFHFADVLENGKVDLLVGKSSGGLILYENTSLGELLNFSQTTNNYLSVGDDFFRSSLKLSSGDLDQDGKQDLIMTDQSGIIRVFSDFRSGNENYDSLSVFNSRENSFIKYTLGKGNTLSLAPLFDTEVPSLVLGSISGGLRILRSQDEYDPSIDTEEALFRTYPNPNTDGKFQVNLSHHANVRALSLKGEVIFDQLNLTKGVNNLDLSSLKAGLYILQAELSNGKLISQKVILY